MTAAAHPRVVRLPDDADSRSLAELASYANDLSEASFALDAALEVGEGGEGWIEFTGFAVVAYMRAFGHSNVRGRLDELFAVPAEFSALHETVRAYRNTTIAHSQSELVAPMAIAYLDETGRIRTVSDIVVSQHLPVQLVRDFARLVSAMAELVERSAAGIRSILEAKYSQTSAETIAEWGMPEFGAELAADFTARSTRTPHSTFTAYWSVGEPVERDEIE
ncbi:hypothetical protein IF188_03065 [Microbacterium sp. NEAU-LLC]|uniref:Uncharacterized protein n=1 Tax=Microbacterium helvum TaxID=2773713 RepID=A0ABR8NL66_9MICO|nr:hypothetical protein [Microbacterium helvum]MBD3940678.1 hypothetical protein [Microbacterium helvum]